MSKWVLTNGSTSLQFFPELDIVDDVKRSTTHFRSRGGVLYQHKHESHREWKVPLAYVNSSFRSIINDWFEDGEYLSLTPGYTTDVTTVAIMGTKRPFDKPTIPYDDQWNGIITLAEQSAPRWPLGVINDRVLGSFISIADVVIRRSYHEWYMGGELGSGGEVRSSKVGITWTAVGGSLGSDVYGISNDLTGYLVAVCQGGFLYTSDDSGATWTSRTSSFGTDHLRGVEHDFDSTWVAVGILGKIATSPDGTTWTQRTNPFTSSASMSAVAHDKLSLWVAVAINGSIPADQLGTSPDGITWTLRTITGVSGALRSVAYNGATWMAVGDQNIFTSTNGTTWTKQSIPAALGSDNIWSVSYTLGTWIIGCTTGVILISTDDGATWIESLNPASSDVTYYALDCDDNGVCVIGGSDLGNTYAARSEDGGGTWSTITTGFAAGDIPRSIVWTT